jgi:hypothetical protein
MRANDVIQLDSYLAKALHAKRRAQACLEEQLCFMQGGQQTQKTHQVEEKPWV